MTEKNIFILLIICMTPIAGIFMYFDHMGGVNFEAEGIVVKAKWNTSNHQMSLFWIQGERRIKKLHHHRVTLTPEQIKVGDSFKKVAGSKICLINDIEIRCVE